MPLVSTPEDRFTKVPDYDYPVERVAVGDPEMAYVDAPGNGPETFLCLHGEPTWGYLYRGLIDRLTDRGRVVVPDAIGFGRSDKYTEREEYDFRLHYDALTTFIERLNLSNITLVCQDWGGALGLTAAANHPKRFARLVPMNTDLPTGDQEMPAEWHRFHDFVESASELEIGRLVRNGTARKLSDAEVAAYDAPYGSEAEKAGAYEWPKMVPRRGGGDGGSLTAAARERLGSWEKPAFVLFSDGDPITRNARDDLRALFPTATEQPDRWISNAGHYLQEDAPEEIAECIVRFVDRT
ncbi:haloalkane dehalogenase [Halostella litorea]|uniref:haloalkane dehalogenase n=1 Tax=Halostella litorea TaxID=2528831 RepID=UPI001092C296|nr:haloalkane dehalogenase [Halostella litorea]